MTTSRPRSQRRQAASLCGSSLWCLCSTSLRRGPSGSYAQSAGGGAGRSRGHAGIVRQLLEHGADVNMEGGHFGNALYAASVKRYTEIVRQLLEHGADVNAQGGHFGNALNAASAEGYTKIVQQLLEGGADVNAQGRRDSNALQAASTRGYAKIVRQLLEHGADVNAQGDHFDNALYAASARGYTEIVRQLLEHGAEFSTDVHGPDRQKEVVAETVLEDGARCLALRTYVSLHRTRL
ncbi:ankyrin repeat-containing domain protein [Podospora australis]|uniref:Ankyrin repeat-containing domain protein n=1 Tax=Podospora australis TaxID=1536484 RepID=A0AAN6WIS7_9PEZI|nr:ankyrin repeat-containing domain protein [Podospora australis]